MSLIAQALRLPASLAGIDLADATRQLDRALHAGGASTVAVGDGLGYVEAKLGRFAMASTMLEGERVARAVLTHIRVAPFFGAVVLVVHPRPEIDAPVLVADLNVVPPGRARAYLDVCGPAIAKPGFRKEFYAPLDRALGATHALRRDVVPGWIAPLSGGCGGVVRARGNTASQLFGVMLRYVETYLACLAQAPQSPGAAANLASARSVGDVVRANGRAGFMLARAFGDATSARYQRLLWND